eukprot:3595001-Alexandrium_andersonii.AAC.1
MAASAVVSRPLAAKPSPMDLLPTSMDWEKETPGPSGNPLEGLWGASLTAQMVALSRGQCEATKAKTGTAR